MPVQTCFYLLGVTFLMFRLIVTRAMGLVLQGKGRKRKLRVDEKETPQTVYLWKKERKRWSPSCSKRRDRGSPFFSSIEKHNYYFGITKQAFFLFLCFRLANWSWVPLSSISSIGEIPNSNKFVYQMSSHLSFLLHAIWDEPLPSFPKSFNTPLWFWWFLILLTSIYYVYCVVQYTLDEITRLSSPQGLVSIRKAYARVTMMGRAMSICTHVQRL